MPEACHAVNLSGNRNQAAIAYPGPGREQRGDKEHVVSLSQQRLWGFVGDVPILSTLVSTGTAETPDVATPLGHHRVPVKLLSETMERDRLR